MQSRFTVARNSTMFNVRPHTYLAGFRVRPHDDVPGFHIDTNNEPRKVAIGDERATFADYDRYPNAMPLDFLSAIGSAGYNFPDGNDARTAGGVGTPALVPGPGGDGSGSGSDRCMLMPRIDQFGFCLYLCPDGTVRRSHDRWRLAGCRPWILRNDGLGL